MKYLILFFLIIGCNSKKEVGSVQGSVVQNLEVHKCPEPIIIHDTIFLTKEYDSLQVIIARKNDSLFVERFKIERVKYYNGIVQRNKTQLKYLSGWINRATK